MPDVRFTFSAKETAGLLVSAFRKRGLPETKWKAAVFDMSQRYGWTEQRTVLILDEIDAVLGRS